MNVYSLPVVVTW